MIASSMHDASCLSAQQCDCTALQLYDMLLKLYSDTKLSYQMLIGLHAACISFTAAVCRTPRPLKRLPHPDLEIHLHVSAAASLGETDAAAGSLRAACLLLL